MHLSMLISGSLLACLGALLVVLGNPVGWLALTAGGSLSVTGLLAGDDGEEDEGDEE
jgi:hypothetical protein